MKFVHQMLIAALFIPLVLGIGCSPSSINSSSAGSGIPGTPSSTGITITASPTTIATLGQTLISATVIDPTTPSGYAADGTIVTFTIGTPSMASFTPPPAAATQMITAVTSGGTAVVTLTATNVPGNLTITADALGLSGTGTITISAQPPSDISITSTPSSINSSATSQITAHVVDQYGTPVQNAQVIFGLDSGLKGRLSGSSIITNGTGDATVTFTAGASSAVATVSASVTNVTPATTQITITGGLAGGTVTVGASPAAIITSGTSTITATVRDGSGALVPNTQVTFQLGDPSRANLSATSAYTNANGQATVVLTGLAVVQNLTITASTATTPALTGTTSININPSGQGSVTVTANSTSIYTSQTTTITASCLDPSGNTPTDGTAVGFSVDQPLMGSLTDITTTVNGVATAVLHAGSTAGSVVVTASWSGLFGTANVGIAIPPIKAVNIVANPPSILALGTTTITATAIDIFDNPAPNGVQINFSISDSTLGTLTVASNSTTGGNGQASTTFIAGNRGGALTASANAGGIASLTPANITIVPAQTGSIEFLSAVPQVLGLKGTGHNETSSVTFYVRDVTGNAASDGTTVTYSMNGPGGGEYIIGSLVGGQTAVSSTVNGNASVVLHSGSVAGPVTIIGTTYVNVGSSATTTLSAAMDNVTQTIPVNDTTNFPSTGTVKIDNELIFYASKTAGSLTSCTRGAVQTQAVNHVINSIVYAQSPVSASATQMSIGGGLPSANHWGIAASQYNLPTSIWNLQDTITAFIADRFGNYNILEGTAVSFYTDAGAIDRTGLTDAAGTTSVIYRTQPPYPEEVSRATGTDIAFQKYFGGFNEPWRPSLTSEYNVRDGWVTILATTQGEEAFLDENGDGTFTYSWSTGNCPPGYSCECDGGTPNGYASTIVPSDLTRSCSTGKRSEAFQDLGEPFYDNNDDGGRDDGSSSPFELFIDGNRNGNYDLPNGVWDGPECRSTNTTVTPNLPCQTTKMIWKDLRLTLSGAMQTLPYPDTNECYATNLVSSCSGTYASGTNFSTAPSPYRIAKGSSGNFCTIIGDSNLNSPPGGTVISATANPGTVSPASITLLDGLSTGPVKYCFSVAVAGEETANSTDIMVNVDGANVLLENVPLSLPPAPDPPTGVSVTSLGGTGPYSARVLWDTVSGATSYNIYWRNAAPVDKTNGTKITGVAPPYDHAGLPSPGTYYYVVSAQGIGGEGNISVERSVTVP